MRSKIVGTGMCVPDRVVTNHDLAKRMDTSDEWIRQRTGIVERRWIEDGQSPADLAEGAALRALEAAGSKPATSITSMGDSTTSASPTSIAPTRTRGN